MSNNDPSRREFYSILRADFYSFFMCAFSQIEPTTQLLPALYLQLISKHLMAVFNGEIVRLLVNLPPRHMKTLITSVAWVAWILAKDPTKKIAIVCHNDSLAIDIALKCKRLIETPWFSQFAPQVRLRADRDRTKDFETTAGGIVFITTVGTGITGRGFHFIILDDPQNAQDAMSEIERQKVVNLLDGSITSRLEDPVNGAILVVQQRLHEADLSGRMLERCIWKHLSLPLRATEDVEYLIGTFRWLRKSGEMLILKD